VTEFLDAVIEMLKDDPNVVSIKRRKVQ